MAVLAWSYGLPLKLQWRIDRSGWAVRWKSVFAAAIAVKALLGLSAVLRDLRFVRETWRPTLTPSAMACSWVFLVTMATKSTNLAVEVQVEVGRAMG
jgi:hypothetical protein